MGLTFLIYNYVKQRRLHMKRNLKVRIAMLTLVSCIFVLPNSLLANTYNGTQINASLNSTIRPDHVALSWSDDPTSTMTISWRTNTSVESSSVEFYPVGGMTETVTAKPELFNTALTDKNSGQMNLFTVTLKNLKPGTNYFYRVGNNKNGWTELYSFTTESKVTQNGNNFKFLVFGDSQSGNMDVPNYNPWHFTLNNAFNANKDAKFFINVGDLVEKGQDYRHWNNWFDAAKGVIDEIPAMVVQGNHETYDAADWNSTKPQYFVNQFNVFQNGPDDLKGQVYSYNYGKVHFVALDSQGEEESEDITGKIDLDKEKAIFQEQVAWLEKDLEANKNAEFTFVFFHKTPYYNKGNRANVLLKQIFTPVLDKYHVDVVFNGHDHASSRTYPMYNDEMMQMPSQGTVYYVTGRSGAKYYPDLTPKVWDAKFYDPQGQPDYQTVELKGDTATIKCFKQDGTLVDTYVIDKNHPENSTSNNEVLPSKYNLKEENSAIGDSLKLIMFGNYANGSSSKATLINGKAYADVQTIASYAEGSYDFATKTLTIGGKEYKFTNDMLDSSGKKVSIDALNKMGFSAKYDTKFNMVFIEN